MSGINPQGCRVESFKQPSAEELSHDFLWRCTRALPALGGISIFNRSYYEDVLVVRVHPELLDRTHEKPDDGDLAKLWKNRLEDINNFEHHLHRNNTRIVKVFLHISRDEQKKRFLKRLDDPDKRWKFSTSDLAEREHWDEYQQAYEEALSATSTPWAPWYVVPADHKYALRALVGGIIVDTVSYTHLVVLGMATVLGVVGPVAAFGVFFLGDRVFHLSRPELQTMMYLTLSVAGHLTIFQARTRGSFWSIRPAKILWVAVLGTQILATVIAVTGIIMTPLGVGYAALVWGLSLIHICG